MEISISKMKIVIEELQVVEMAYKKQVSAFERIFHEYQSLDQEGNDRNTLKKIFEDLYDEYLSIKRLKEALTEIVRFYDNAERNIIKWSSNTFGNSPVLKKIDIKLAQKILDKHNIKII